MKVPTMHALKISVISCAAALLTGCASLEQASSSFSCMLSRVTSNPDGRCGGAAPATANNGAIATTAPAVSRFDKLQAVLDEEAELAQTVQADVVAALEKLPTKLRAVAGPVETLDVQITDSQTGQARTLRALDSVTVDMPVAAKGRAEYTRAMDSLKNLANHLADNRGSSSINVLQSDADVKAKRVNTATGVTKTNQGSSVSVEKEVSRSLPRGIERYTIKAGEIRGQM